MHQPPRILFCQCAYAQAVPAEVTAAVLKTLKASGRSFDAVPDLCELAANQDHALAKYAAAGPLRIAACYPRAIKWLFAAAGAPLSPESTEVLNLREPGALDRLDSLLESPLTPNLPAGAIAPSPARPAALAAQAHKPGGWSPWFPVIDYERCTHCMQCLSFCLFGVFGVDEQHRIQVQQSRQCKTNCPACSRVCPEAAIIFPKYKSAPINGELIDPLDVQREKMKIDISALLGGDVYQVLRQRSERAQSRFSKERDPGKALEERQKCLARMAQAAEIPPEVLRALPSPEEIERKAREAMARAQAARQAQAGVRPPV